MMHAISENDWVEYGGLWKVINNGIDGRYAKDGDMTGEDGIHYKQGEFCHVSEYTFLFMSTMLEAMEWGDDKINGFQPQYNVWIEVDDDRVVAEKNEDEGYGIKVILPGDIVRIELYVTDKDDGEHTIILWER